MNNKDIYNFAIKWIEKFNDKNTNYVELVDGDLGNDCIKLGFKMDCGKSFEKNTGISSITLKS